MTAREHSRRELWNKLSTRHYAEDDIERVLKLLAEQGLQSDARFTEQYIEGRVAKGNGPLRIRAELRERGISDDLIAVHLDCFAEDWKQLMQGVHDSKYGAESPSNRRELARRARFLEYRGFPSDLIGDFLLRHL